MAWFHLKEKPCNKPTFIKDRPIAIINPSISDKVFLYRKIDQGIKNLKEMGFKVLGGPYLYEDYFLTEEGYRKRASLINSLFANKEIGGLICRTGGFGAKYILESLDLEIIRDNIKAFCGYSDDTFLLVHLNDKLKMVVFHGPSLIDGFSEPSELTKEYFIKVFSETKYPLEIQLDSLESWRNGKATGKVLGGNLTILVDYLDLYPDTSFKNKILFIEEVDESFEKIDALLYRLNKKGVFDSLKGILIGRFFGLDKTKLDAIKKYLLQHLNKKEIPVLYGFKSGHSNEKITLPFGTDVTIDADELKVIYEECPFI